MTKDCYLIRPTKVFKRSYIDALSEGFTEGNRLPRSPEEIISIDMDFCSHIDSLDKDSQGIIEIKGRHIPSVPSSAFWMVDGNQFIGSASIRVRIDTEIMANLGGHIGFGIRPTKKGAGYGKKILSLALDVARGLGIGNIRISCNESNARSRAVIEANQGVFVRRCDRAWYADEPFLIFEIPLSRL